ncbi:MAG: hypothetical protein QOE36_1131 [Gaiellaceae bacterium]|jgi:exopolysaccharide biosynthesis polyprenyl glycosylphosphotransferase|nr:hypothetical protein [Gaiellaceae bacterium]
MLLLADVLGLCSAFMLTELWLGQGNSTGGLPDHLHRPAEYAIALMTLPVWIVAARLYGLYKHDEVRTDHSTTDELVSVFHLVTVGCWGLAAAGWVTGAVRPDFGKLLLFWSSAIALITLLRVGARAFCRRRPEYEQVTLIVGAGDVGQRLARKILQHPEYGLNLLGFLDSSPKERLDDLADLCILGPISSLPEVIRLHDVERVVFAFSNESDEELLDLIRVIGDYDVQIDVVPRVFELVSPGVSIHTIEGLPMIGLPSFSLPRVSRATKRLLDVVVSVLALLLLTPLFAVAAAAIKLTSSGPVFFRQQRVGLHRQTFRIFKFRTMYEDAEERKAALVAANMHARLGGDPRMFKLPDDPRVTPVGRLLRRYSLDEVPQLVNVLLGQMSLVGPRPLILDEDRHVVDWAQRRLYVKPGITGLWQVLGRSEIAFGEMTRLDSLYVANWSVWGDLLLMLRTIPVVFRGQSAY